MAATRVSSSSRVSTLDDLRKGLVSANSISNIPQATQQTSGAEDDARQTAQERFDMATRRLERNMAVNAQLQSALVKRRILSRELRTELEPLEQRIDGCRSMEEPARVADLHALEQEITEEQRRLQETSLELGRGIMDLDERVSALSAGNVGMRETSTRRRAMLREQEAELRAQKRAVKSLTRHIQIMEEGTDYDQLTGWSLSDVRMPDGQGLDQDVAEEDLAGAAIATTPAAQQRASTPSMSGLGRSLGADVQALPPPQTIEDYRKLPGLDLQLLLSHTSSSFRGHAR